MNENQEVTNALLKQSLDSLHSKMDEKWGEVKTHEKRISVVEDWKGMVNTLGGWVLAPAIGTIIASILYLVMKR